MKKKLEIVFKIAVMIASVVWVLSLMPFNREINQRIPAMIYDNGIAVEETMVNIEGMKSEPLFWNSDSFSGKFHVLSYERTTRNEMKAGISWNPDNNIQSIRFFMYGNTQELDILHYMLINEDMTKFALMFQDGTVLATSEEIYTLFTRHFSTSGERTMVIVDEEDIPVIK